MSETILIVDDEEPVRRTFADWLTQAKLGCTIVSASDAESALRLANQQPIDLAILDWALGAGDDGLQLLQDLYAFHPEVVAIMVTGFANQATPLDAMRMGVRDYLDKNHDLNRTNFLKAVTRQLDLIRPAKQARQWHQSLLAFREAVEKVLPIVQSTAALTDPVPLPEAVRALVRFSIRATQASDGVLVVYHNDATREPAEQGFAYDAAGTRLTHPLVPRARSIAGAALSLGKPSIMDDLSQVVGIELQAFEQGRRRLLALPMTVGQGIQVVIELFDKRDGSFNAEDQQYAQSASDLGTELLRQALGQRQTQQLLLDAISAALGATDAVSASDATTRQTQPPPAEVMQQLRVGLHDVDAATADLRVDLAEAIRVLAAKHGRPALEHSLTLLRELRRLLDTVTGE